MRIVQVITGLQKAAGTTTFVENVVRELKSLGHEVEIVTNYEALAQRSRLPDIVHIHGLWSPLLHKASVWARKNNIAVVWSTHGMTAPWSLKHKWWKKCLPWYLYQKRDLKQAALIHSTTELEREWNNKIGFTRQVVVPLGTHLPKANEVESWKLKVESEGEKESVLLYVGRVYPVKALDNLIRAFAQAVGSRLEVGDERWNWKLRIVGPDQAGYMAELMQLCEKLGLSYTDQDGNFHRSTSNLQSSTCPQVEFVGPKYDEDLSVEYDKCGVLALVSHTENFGATVIDAMAHGRAALTSTKTPWKIVADRGCGWWVDNGVESLARTIERIMNLTEDELRAMGEQGRKLVEEEYQWPVVAKRMAQGYEMAKMKCEKGYCADCPELYDTCSPQ